MGLVKCSQAIENSIAEDCFNVPNIEEIFKTALSLEDTAHEDISTNYTVEKDAEEKKKLEMKQNQFKAKPREKVVEKKNTKLEAKDFLGPLR